MASPMFSIVCLLFLLLKNSDATLHLDVNPADITPGLTDSLAINCSFSFSGVTNMSGIISLIVSKSEVNTTQFQDLVSVNVFAPDNMTIAPDFDGVVSGHIDTNGDSYISVHWTYPTADQAATLRCEVHGMDSSGHPMEMFHISQVTSQRPNMDQLTDEVSQLHRLTNSQSEAITTLLSLTKSQSEIISAQQLQLDNMESRLNLVATALLLPFHVSSVYNGHYYLLSKHNWTDTTAAAETCNGYGGYVAHINDDNKNQFLKDFLDQRAGFIYTYVRVNGTDESHEGRWTSTGSDTDLEFTNWLSGYPETRPEYNCIIAERQYQWQWWDGSCSETYKFLLLCEMEKLPVQNLVN